MFNTVFIAYKQLGNNRKADWLKRSSYSVYFK